MTIKYSFDKSTEELLFRNSIPSILHDGAQFENIPLTLLQTKDIVDNNPVSGIRPADVVTVHNMHKGAQFILDNYEHFDFDSLLKLHSYTGADDVKNPGELRNGKGIVQTTKGEFIPPKVSKEDAEREFNHLLNTSELDAETKATKLFSHLSRAQLFNDTNKRTAVLTANVPLLKEGAGVFYIPEPAMENTLQLMGDYYWSNDDRLITEVLKEIAITDFDGKTFYDARHQYYEYADEHKKKLNLFKGLNAKGLLGKEKVQELTMIPAWMGQDRNAETDF